MNIDVMFNRNPLVFGGTMEQPTDLEVKNSFGLWNASYDDAIRYGGDVTRQALRCMNLRHDRKNIIVDVKIHMLMKGMSPAIPGWHADGAPRGSMNPNGKEAPDTLAQEFVDRFNHYHILVTGTGCLTQFISRPIKLSIDEKPSYRIYEDISEQAQRMTKEDPSLILSAPSCGVVEFDWWDVHTGIIATKNEWRYLIRVAESDYYEPRTDLREVIRMQSQVYCPHNFSW